MWWFQPCQPLTSYSSSPMSLFSDSNSVSMGQRAAATRASVESGVASLLNTQVDGILYATMFHRNVAVPAGLRGTPTVLIDASADAAIPAELMQNAAGLAFLTVVKAGMIWTGKLGTGLVIARLGDGSWSPPSGGGEPA